MYKHWEVNLNKKYSTILAYHYALIQKKKPSSVRQFLATIVAALRSDRKEVFLKARLKNIPCG